ncbi:MAG: hypothetical protein QG588_375 [Candidatus Poribacteria bacterium]|nr:hypothetical protein [Candidatus Poribacteria bacterium]
MKIKLVFCLSIIIAVFVTTTHAAEPTWLFAVPKAESLKEGNYTIGFVYLDFGMTNEIDIGIHGLKYSTGDVAFGVGLYPMGLTPYIVFSPPMGKAELSLGIKASPYWFFAGLEAPITDKFKFIAEFNNGLSAGVRIIPARDWSVDLFVLFVPSTFNNYFDNYYLYKYQKIDVGEYRPIPWIAIAYSGKF